MKSTTSIYVIIISLFLIGCSENKEKKKFSLSEQDCIAFAKKIESSMGEKDPSVLDNAFEGKTLIERINKGQEGDKELMDKQKLEENSDKIVSRFKLGSEILKSQGNCYYTFMKYYVKEGTPHLVFRVFGKAGLNYNDFELVEADGKVKFADCYVLLTGQNLSQTIRELMISMTNSTELFGTSIASNVNENAMESLEKVKEVRAALNAGDTEKAKEVFYSISEEYRKQRIFRILELSVAPFESEEKYLQVMENFKKDFPDDPSLHLLALDHYFIKKEYVTLRKELDALEKEYGNDAVLDYLRGNSYFMQGDHKTAKTYFYKMAEKYPDYIDAWNSILATSMEDKDYSSATKAMDKLVESSDYTKSDIVAYANQFPAFTNSKEFKEWNKAEHKEELNDLNVEN